MNHYQPLLIIMNHHYYQENFRPAQAGKSKIYNCFVIFCHLGLSFGMCLSCGLSLFLLCLCNVFCQWRNMTPQNENYKKLTAQNENDNKNDKQMTTQNENDKKWQSHMTKNDKHVKNKCWTSPSLSRQDSHNIYTINHYKTLLSILWLILNYQPLYPSLTIMNHY